MERKRSKAKAPVKKARSKSTRRTLSYGPANARVVAAVGPNVGLGTSLTTNLRTSFFANLTGASSGIYQGYLKPGSLFDPCGSISDVQPALFDQYAAVFARYKVNKFTVIIKIIGTNGGASAYTFNAAAYPSTDQTALANYQGAASQPWAKTGLGTFMYIGSPTVAGAGTDSVTLKFNNVSNDAVVGAKADTYDSGALVTADPPAGQYASMPIFIQANTNVVVGYVIHVDMWQNVTFNQRKPVADA